MDLPRYHWKELESLARGVVDDCRAALPDELREMAARIPCILLRWHPDVEGGDEEAIDMMGEYLAHEGNRQVDESGVIALYLGGIALYCEEEGLDFEDEVETTYLHELGHHFGWDEDEVWERGL